MKSGPDLEELLPEMQKQEFMLFTFVKLCETQKLASQHKIIFEKGVGFVGEGVLNNAGRFFRINMLDYFEKREGSDQNVVVQIILNIEPDHMKLFK